MSRARDPVVVTLGGRWWADSLAPEAGLPRPSPIGGSASLWVGGSRDVVVRPVADVLPPGELRGDLVGTGTTAVRLGVVRPEGRAEMAAADWLRGLRPGAGERFG